MFDDRYHLEVLRSPTQVRNALCYVLLNARRHGEQLDPRFHGADPFSSAWWFDGWTDDEWREGLRPPDTRTVAEPQTWMLRVGWVRTKCGSCSGTRDQPAWMDPFICYSCAGRSRARRSSRPASSSSMSSQVAS